MFYFILTVLLTLAVSAFCSLMEAMILSTTPVEVENLKRRSKRRGNLLEKFVSDIDETTSAILTANTIANTFGATLAGIQCARIFGSDAFSGYVFPAFLTVCILFFSEILPKNIGILYRPSLQPFLVWPLYWLVRAMKPVCIISSWVIGKISSRRKAPSLSDDEIILLADKGERDGLISEQERKLIANTLSLDDVVVSEIMTPRTVVVALDETSTAAEAFRRNRGLGFSRMPVYRDTIDNIVGVVRRRDILKAVADDRDTAKISELVQPAVFVPENGSALSVLRILIKKHQQIGIVVDEFASLTGVVSLEDIFEHLLGSEIFESDDIAVDMREFARRRKGGKATRQ